MSVTNKMKMPEVRKRYRSIRMKHFEVLVTSITNNIISYCDAELRSLTHQTLCQSFWDSYEEVRVGELEKGNVQVALDELKELLLKECLDESYFGTLKAKTQNLMNALDHSTIPEKADYGIVEDTKERKNCFRHNKKRINDWMGCEYCQKKYKANTFIGRNSLDHSLPQYDVINEIEQLKAKVDKLMEGNKHGICYN